MLSSTLATLSGLLCILQSAIAVPDLSSDARGRSIPLVRRQPTRRTVEDWGVWAKNERDGLAAKYGGSLSSKRSEGTNLLINQNTDSSYVGSLAIGTPASAFYVILDTGSSDLWVLGANCGKGCSGLPTYTPASSSTSHNLSQPFSVTYGSGQAAGSLFSDVVQMAGFQVTNQGFGAVTQTSQHLVSSPVSGLLGLGWQRNAASGQTPFWQALASKGAWSQPVMGFQLTRFGNSSSARPLEPGGSFTMGFVNSSLYTGNIDYQNLVTTPGFWTLSLSQLVVQGSSLPLPSGSASFAAVDTGTTLIGGPSSVIQNIYTQIPGSQPGVGNWRGYWMYPCNAQVNVAMSFGGPSWPISPADFELTQISPNQCIGAFFEIDTNGNAPNWIVGDTFLKNVYSVFRYSPPSVGFAALSATALSMNGVNGPPPTATIGSVTASVAAPTAGATNSGAHGARLGFHPFVVVCGLVVGALLL